MKRDASSFGYRPSRTPSAVSGLALWLRADIGVTVVSGSVSQWNDQSGNGRNFAQATPAKRPTFNASDPAFNNLPSLGFAHASAQQLTFGALVTAQPLTAFIVGDVTAISTYLLDGSGGGRLLLGRTSGVLWQMFAGTANIFPSGANTSPHVICAVFADPSSALYVDNSQTPIGTGAVGTDSFGAAGQTISLGGFDANATNLTGTLTEVLVYNTALGAADRESIAQYLGGKWGIAVS